MKMAAEYFCHAVDLEEITSLLNDPEIHNDHFLCRNAMRKVLMMMSFERDLTAAFPYLVKLLAHPDLLVKKVACHYLIEYARKDHEHALLAINTLLTDCSDSNPMARGLALKTICSLQHEEFTEYGLRALTQGLKDRSAYVRRIAVTSCLRLHNVSDSAILDNGLVDELYMMIRDPDPIVVANSLMVLEEILHSEGGVVVNRNMAYYLCNQLPKLMDWGVANVFSVLCKYKPQSEEEMFDIMNVTDSFLTHTNTAVCTSAVKFFLHLVHDFPNLKLEVFGRTKETISATLTSGETELTYSLLGFIESTLPECKSVFSGDIQPFFCRYKEPPYLKAKRIQLLAQFSTETNISDILDELAGCCTDMVPQVASIAISTLGEVAQVSNEFLGACLAKLTELVDTEVGHVLSNVVQVVESLPVKSSDHHIAQILDSLCGKYHFLTDSKGRSAFLWILGEFQQDIPEGAYILEDVLDIWLEESDAELKRSLLTASLKLFFHNPATCQEILGQVMESCMNADNPDLSDTARFYYKLLHTDISQAKLMILGTSTCTSTSD